MSSPNITTIPIRFELKLHSDGQVLLKGPTGVTDPANPVALDTATSVDVRLFEANESSLVALDSVTSESTVTVEDASKLKDDALITARLDDLSYFEAQISDRDEATNIITLDTPTAGGLFIPKFSWSSIQRRFGTAIPMTRYGNAPFLPNSLEWGYRGAVAYDLAGLDESTVLRAEIDFDGGAGLRFFVVLPQIAITEGGG